MPACCSAQLVQTANAWEVARDALLHTARRDCLGAVVVVKNCCCQLYVRCATVSSAGLRGRGAMMYCFCLSLHGFHLLFEPPRQVLSIIIA
jgi:hypothetical protein